MPSPLEVILKYYPDDSELRRLLIHHSTQIAAHALGVAARHPELNLNTDVLYRGAMLHDIGIPMEPKPFSMGVRIEHPQSMVNISQYGADNPVLPPADYKLVRHLDNGTVYTFCMCPGGYVVAAASEEGRTVTNGMSYADRDGENANSALLVTVNPEEFPFADIPLRQSKLPGWIILLSNIISICSGKEFLPQYIKIILIGTLLLWNRF